MISNLAARTRAIGAICESSRWLAQRMVDTIESPLESPIVELGAGYGSLTRLLPETAISIEREPKRFDYLRSEFAGRTILDCCAISYLPALQTPTVVISSIPSMNNPEFDELRDAVARARRDGKILELVSYTYFPLNNPFGGIFDVEKRAGLEIRNLPPAFVWRYSC